MEDGGVGGRGTGAEGASGDAGRWGAAGDGRWVCGVRIRVSPFFLCEEGPPWLFKGLDFSFPGELFSSGSLGTKASRPASETRKRVRPRSQGEPEPRETHWDWSLIIMTNYYDQKLLLLEGSGKDKE